MFNDPRTRRATTLGLVLVALTMCCCVVTAAGWVRGTFDTLTGSNLDQTVRSEVSAPVSGAIALEVEHAVGNVTVLNDGTDEVRVEVTARSETLELARAVAATLTAEGQQFALRLTGAEEDEVQVDLVIHTPRETALSLSSSVGTIEVTGLAGPLEIEHASGAVTVLGHDAAERLRVDAGASNVSVTLESIAAGTRVALSSRAGGVDISMPDSVGFRLEASADVGAVDVGGYNFSSRTDKESGAGNTLVGVVDPADGRTLTLEASVGDIYVRGR